MISRARRNTSRLTAILGATVGVLMVFGASTAVSAFAAPTWHVNGQPFSGQETFSGVADGPIKLDVYAWIQITCSESAVSGRIYNSRQGEASVVFDGCEVRGAPACAVSPLPVESYIELIEADGRPYVEFTPKAGAFGGWEIQECMLSGWWPVRGSVAAEVGGEASLLALGLSAEAIGTTGSEGFVDFMGGNRVTYADGTLDLSLTNGQEWGVGA